MTNTIGRYDREWELQAAWHAHCHAAVDHCCRGANSLCILSCICQLQVARLQSADAFCTSSLQDFEYAVLGLSPPEPGVDGGTAVAFEHDEGLNELDASELFERAAAHEGAGGSGLGAEAVALVPRATYGT